MSLIFLVVCAALVPMAHLAGAGITLAVLAALFVSLIPTTIGALLSAIGIAGMNRLVRRNVLATSAARSRPPVTCRCSCSTRPARSRSETARPHASCPSVA